MELSPADRDQLVRHGLDHGEVERQLHLLRHPPPRLRLLRPCTPGDGVVELEEGRHRELLARHAAAAAAGRLRKLVPASGAASRMFRALQAVRNGDPTAADREAWARVRRQLDKLPFYPELAACLRARGVSAAAGDAVLLDALLGEDGLDLAHRPKGLLPFHRSDGGVLTACEEHLVEGAAYLRDAGGRCRLHFTVAPQHRDAFRRLVECDPNRLRQRCEAVFEVGFSTQSPATDTVAITPEGELFRRDDGRLLLRPGGHGSLLRNLQALGGDVVYLKNVDNVLPAPRQGLVAYWQKLLAGHLLALEERIAAILRQLDGGGPGEAELDDALRFVAATFGARDADPSRHRGAAAKSAYLRRRLHRPLRVCGMVRVRGEPGGGPFWVEDEELGASPQIVELAQIDLRDPQQRRIVAAATHFNPVALVCALRDPLGEAYDLQRFVDRRAVFISRKSAYGRPLHALEHPGLWNGAMARWNSVFVDVPAATFAPVKTVLDLLRPEHQP